MTEIVMYIIARQDLGMSAGKLAAQVGHGVQLAMRHAETNCGGVVLANLVEWERGSYAKIVLGARDQGAMDCLAVDLNMAELNWIWVFDEGRTELRGINSTCIALVPMPKSKAAPVVGKLRLYK
jgi:peptidyl-tRNA hydrolase, PTH2 family